MTDTPDWTAHKCECGKEECTGWYVEGPPGIHYANTTEEAAKLIAASPALLAPTEYLAAAEASNETALPGIYGEYFDWVRTQPCVLTGVRDHRCWGHVTAHHVKSVGAGGRDFANLVAVCALAHMSVHQLGRLTFCKRWCVSLRSAARALAERYERLHDV